MRTKKIISPLQIIVILIIALLVVISIYPVLWLLLSSFKTQTEFSMNPVYALPESLAFENYIDAWTTGNMGVSFLNSVLCTAGSMILIVIVALPVSFAISKMVWRLKNKTHAYIMIGLMVPVQVCLIPLFTIYNNI